MHIQPPVPRRTLPALLHATALSLLLSGTACTDPTGATQSLLLVPSATTLSVEQVQQDGFRAMFHNRTGATISLQGWGCSSHGVTVYRHLTGVGWLPQTVPSPQTAAGTLVACPQYLIPPEIVQAGDSTLVTGFSTGSATGLFRLEIATTAGTALSPTVRVR